MISFESVLNASLNSSSESSDFARDSLCSLSKCYTSALFSFQFQFSMSDVDTYNGTLKWWYDGLLIFDRTDLRTVTSAANQTTTSRPHTLGWNVTGFLGSDYQNHVHFDDLYADNTWARVEVGNASTHNACTVREMQPPTAWSATSITIGDFNQGAFALDDPVYFYVTDSAGNTSPAYGPLYIEGEGGGPPATITPVDTLRVVDQ